MDAIRAKGTVREFREIVFREDWLQSKYVGMQVPILPDADRHLTFTYVWYFVITIYEKDIISVLFWLYFNKHFAESII